MSTKTLLMLGIVCLIAGAIFASLTFTGTFSWGFNMGALYQTYVNGRAAGGLMAGRRFIETNNGVLAILIWPFLITGAVLLFSAARGISLNGTKAGSIIAPFWGGALLSFPVYAIVLVNMFYDSGLRGAVAPALVMLLPIVIGFILIGARSIDRKARLR